VKSFLPAFQRTPAIGAEAVDAVASRVMTELAVNDRYRWMRTMAGIGEENLPPASNGAHLSVPVASLSAWIISCPDRAEDSPRRDKVAILANVG